MYERILLPVDGSDVADAAAEAAVAIARRFDAELHVVHVLEFGERLPESENDAADEFARLGEEAVTRGTELAADAGVDATGTILEGGRPVYRAVLEYADDHDVDCLVMGTYGRTGLDRFVLGSVAERLLRESPVPVVTVHEETVVDSTIDSVLVPTDGSDCAAAAVDHAIELATATDAALHAVNVVDLGVFWDESAAVALDALEDAGERVTERVVERAGDAGVATADAAVLTGTPHREILTYADEHDVDCIVMGTHGRSGLDRVLLGSVTERVVRHTDVPVVSVKDQS
ncbi:universal stress protein [Natrinema sp. 1APR25-10V2]|uniref:universal stress protein n=1 Tax=Natrinema sp. 1APR25-10V2 TaxID=2951081 RepID=UPI0028740FA7|nr:universal stress protein [Natrinema sp. 1APR25-10V2]MDS0474439.1 universal stress protein [Natrinema sp. 1APR25-10V2]